MKCDICDLKEAVMHIHQIIGNKKKKLHLCEKCAEEKGIVGFNETMEINMANLFSGFFNTGKGQRKKKDEAVVCPGCGMTYNDFNKKNKAGCHSCFETFSQLIKYKLKKLTGLKPYGGKLPRKLHSYKVLFVDVEKLKIRLEEALKVEDYETAAQLRDQINQLKTCGAE